MTDLEVTRLCANAMGYPITREMDKSVVCSTANKPFTYWPIYDDAQAMALVKKFKLTVGWNDDGAECVVMSQWQADNYAVASDDANTAICGCVAKMQATAQTQPKEKSPDAPG